ncbi:MAG: VPLPA-CTERM sorting domain-containing protein [Roseobacter sp.]
MFRYLCAAVLIGIGSGASAVTLTNALPTGTTVDLSSLSTNTALSSSESVFTSAGISSITVNTRASSNSERYDAGSTFGAGRALFNLENGDLIALDEGATGTDFGSPTFTIDFASLVSSFGLRIADTSSSFVTPVFTFEKNGSQIDQITFTDPYTAATEFGFADAGGFDRILISTGDSDGYGISSLVVGSAVVTNPNDPSVVPLPAGLPLLLSGFALFAGVRRFRK